MEMTTKRIFINSTGRTGTQFFAKYLNKMIPNSVALHEPGTPWIRKTKQLLEQINDYGLYHLTLGQSKNTHSMYKLSRDYIAKEISREKAIKNILKINNKVDSLNKAKVCVYSSGHIYGLLDLLDEVYPDSKFVFIVRDPRDWINSAMNKFEFTLYGSVEIFYRKISLKPDCFENDPYMSKWEHMSKFEKYCWFYNKVNNIALTAMKDKNNFKVFKYEDIFLSENKAQQFNNVLEFATDFEEGKLEYTNIHKYLNVKIDSVRIDEQAKWHNWPKEKAQIMAEHCGKLMKQFGYGNESNWREKLGL